jgi:alanyl-tRNA synthetase
MKAEDLRRKFIDFFVSKGHVEIKSSPLVPENDPTCLFTTAGMHPLVPFLLGEPHPAGNKLVNYQKCVRTGDIDAVGDATHLTFFEMLGNWSLGEYFKKESIAYSYELLTNEKWLNLPVEKLAFSVFAGDEDAPFDQEAFDCWVSHGISEKRIAKLEKKHNWWGPAGQTGPCGPDTEIFFWTGDEDAPESFDEDDERWVEIWNNVFMEYFKDENGQYQPLKQKNVDTGMGLERVTAILQGKESCYDTELFIPLFETIDKIRGNETPTTRTRSERIIVEHIRTATFMLMDGVVPGNTDQNYVLRRLIRRAIVQAHKIGITDMFTSKLAKTVIDNYSTAYPAMLTAEKVILEELDREEKQFQKTLEKGTKEFDKLISRVPEHVVKKVISGKNAFNLYETYGFPLEITIELAEDLQLTKQVSKKQ